LFGLKKTDSTLKKLYEFMEGKTVEEILNNRTPLNINTLLNEANTYVELYNKSVISSSQVSNIKYIKPELIQALKKKAEIYNKFGYVTFLSKENKQAIEDAIIDINARFSKNEDEISSTDQKEIESIVKKRITRQISWETRNQENAGICWAITTGHVFGRALMRFVVYTGEQGTDQTDVPLIEEQYYNFTYMDDHKRDLYELIQTNPQKYFRIILYVFLTLLALKLKDFSVMTTLREYLNQQKRKIRQEHKKLDLTKLLIVKDNQIVNEKYHGGHVNEALNYCLANYTNRDILEEIDPEDFIMTRAQKNDCINFLCKNRDKFSSLIFSSVITKFFRKDTIFKQKFITTLFNIFSLNCYVAVTFTVKDYLKASHDYAASKSIPPTRPYSKSQQHTRHVMVLVNIAIQPDGSIHGIFQNSWNTNSLAVTPLPDDSEYTQSSGYETIPLTNSSKLCLFDLVFDIIKFTADAEFLNPQHIYNVSSIDRKKFVYIDSNTFNESVADLNKSPPPPLGPMHSVPIPNLRHEHEIHPPPLYHEIPTPPPLSLPYEKLEESASTVKNVEQNAGRTKRTKKTKRRIK